MAVMTKALFGSCSFQVAGEHVLFAVSEDDISGLVKRDRLKHLECERECLSRSLCGVLQAYTHCSSSEERHLPEMEQ